MTYSTRFILLFSVLVVLAVCLPKKEASASPEYENPSKQYDCLIDYELGKSNMLGYQRGIPLPMMLEKFGDTDQNISQIREAYTWPKMSLENNQDTMIEKFAVEMYNRCIAQQPKTSVKHEPAKSDTEPSKPFWKF